MNSATENLQPVGQAPARVVPASWPVATELFQLLREIPEFWAAGFRAELSRSGRDVLIYRRSIRTARWRGAGSALVWTSTGATCPSTIAASPSEAAYWTMKQILRILISEAEHSVLRQ